MSLQILRRRILEEMQKPIGDPRRPRFQSDAQLARFLGLEPSQVSRLLRARDPKNARGTTWKVIDRLARAFDCQVWELFYAPAQLFTKAVDVRPQHIFSQPLTDTRPETAQISQLDTSLVPGRANRGTTPSHGRDLSPEHVHATTTKIIEAHLADAGVQAPRAKHARRAKTASARAAKTARR